MIGTRTALLLCVYALCVTVHGCGVLSRSAPSWVDGRSADYPPDQYLVATGQGESKTSAVERAYGAVAKIFKAEVSAQSRDWESFLVMEQRGQASIVRRLTLDHVTNVSTDKVLENVSIIETWHDRRTGLHYALAGIHRAQAGSSLVERIAELDRATDTAVAESRQSMDKLAKVRNLRRAVKHLVLREAYNSDLRVVRVSGQGVAPAYRVPELTAELEQFLAAGLLVGVEVAGEQAEVTRRAVIEGLIREGLPVTDRKIDPAQGIEDAPGKAPELLVGGSVRLWDVPMPDPQFRYVRWCSDFQIVEIGTQRIVGAVSIGGREGHLTPYEARAKAVRVMQQELTSNLARTLAAYIYGEIDPPVALPPSACPKIGDRTSPPPPAIRPL